ncbi:MAG: hypothetical protein QOE90_676 [Thermoplasmata archaeon]|jgi:rhodanese-related sulfurtransferase|nr:hypothetical protein [Thermoplasmata archaeon]
MRAPLLALLLAAILALPARVQAAADDPTDPRTMTWIEPGALALGGGGLDADQVAWLASQGVRAIADVRAEHEDPADAIAAQGMDFLWLPIDKASDMDAGDVARFVAWAQDEAARGKPIYLHCTNGWHRSAAFAIAFEMAQRNLTFDEAARRVESLRPEVLERAPGPLLAYQAMRAGQPGLDVVLDAPATAPRDDAPLPVTVHVFAGAQPAAGARVRAWTAEHALDLALVTNETGEATFDLPRPDDGSFMDHLYARASLPGFVDGADQAEVLYGADVKPAKDLALDLHATDDALRVRLRWASGELHARVYATDGEGWSAFAATANGSVVLPAPPAGHTVTVRAWSWGAGARTATAERAPERMPIAVAGNRVPTPSLGAALAAVALVVLARRRVRRGL